MLEDSKSLGLFDTSNPFLELLFDINTAFKSELSTSNVRSFPCLSSSIRF